VTRDWKSIPLGQLLTRTTESVLLEPDVKYREVTIKLWGKGVQLRKEVLGTEIAADRRTVVRPGQFILSKIDARNGAFGLVPESLDGAVVTNDFPAFNVNKDRLEPAFLRWLSRTSSFVDWCRAASEGTTNRVRLNESRFLATPILIPLLEEQRRIVARVEAMAARLEEARGLRHWNQKEQRFFDAGIARRIFENSFWPFKSVGELCEVKSGVQKSVDRIPGANARRYITVAHVQRNRISTNDPRYFEVSPEEFDRWKLFPGDVLVVEGNGSVEHVGRAALFRGEIENCIHQNHVIRVRPNAKYLLPEFLNAYFNSPVGREQMLERSRTTSGLYTLSTGRIREIRIPLPSLLEQQNLITRLMEHQRVLEKLEQLQESSRLELTALLPSILAKAFAGEL
jgi:type I restriction enzyme, S subunit